MMTVFFAACLATACFWGFVFCIADQGRLPQAVMAIIAIGCGLGLVLSQVMS
jgi:hypothetical protein